jgi:hypothetical protein
VRCNKSDREPRGIQPASSVAFEIGLLLFLTVAGVVLFSFEKISLDITAHSKLRHPAGWETCAPSKHSNSC